MSKLDNERIYGMSTAQFEKLSYEEKLEVERKYKEANKEINEKNEEISKTTKKKNILERFRDTLKEANKQAEEEDLGMSYDEWKDKKIEQEQKDHMEKLDELRERKKKSSWLK